MNPYTNEAIKKLRDLPIEGVAERLGLKVTHHKTLCPFHNDNHPSLSIHVRRNSYKCFVCGAHGGVIDLAMHVLGKNFIETCDWLANGHNMIMSYHTKHTDIRNQKSEFRTEKYAKYFIRPFLIQEARSFLFTERKLHPGVIRWCRLNSFTDRHGTPWLQIPYFDIDGQLIGVQNRALSPKPPRFLFPRGSRISIYNLPILKLLKPGEELWIAEGCSDCWALLSSGRKAIAIPSATLLNEKDLILLSPHFKGGDGEGSLHMSPDADIPGEKLYLQLKQLFPQLVRHSLPPGIKDFAEYYISSSLTANRQHPITNSQQPIARVALNAKL
jgi:DNA primase